jgi:hypothetical protein
VSTQTDVTYDSHRNPSSEKVSAGGTTHTLIQRSFDDSGRLECEARRMNPVAFASPPGACSLGSEGSFGPDRITHNIYDNAGQLQKVQRAYGTSLQQDLELTRFRGRVEDSGAVSLSHRSSSRS